MQADRLLAHTHMRSHPNTKYRHGYSAALGHAQCAHTRTQSTLGGFPGGAGPQRGLEMRALRGLSGVRIGISTSESQDRLSLQAREQGRARPAAGVPSEPMATGSLSLHTSQWSGPRPGWNLNARLRLGRGITPILCCDLTCPALSSSHPLSLPPTPRRPTHSSWAPPAYCSQVCISLPWSEALPPILRHFSVPSLSLLLC